MSLPSPDHSEKLKMMQMLDAASQNRDHSQHTPYGSGINQLQALQGAGAGSIDPAKMQALQNAAQNMINNPSIAQHIQNLLAQFQQQRGYPGQPAQQPPRSFPGQPSPPIHRNYGDLTYYPDQGAPWNDLVYRGDQPIIHDLLYRYGEQPPWGSIAMAAQERLRGYGG